ncbi:MAG: hypothetical protein LBK53_08025 [Heliobacteriaceae bacterium]|nr:hypothetical protein [Heliobacteriaceae bacterium]
MLLGSSLLLMGIGAFVNLFAKNNNNSYNNNYYNYSNYGYSGQNYSYMPNSTPTYTNSYVNYSNQLKQHNSNLSSLQAQLASQSTEKSGGSSSLTDAQKHVNNENQMKAFMRGLKCDELQAEYDKATGKYKLTKGDEILYNDTDYAAFEAAANKNRCGCPETPERQDDRTIPINDTNVKKKKGSLTSSQVVTFKDEKELKALLDKENLGVKQISPLSNPFHIVFQDGTTLTVHKNMKYADILNYVKAKNNLNSNKELAKHLQAQIPNGRNLKLAGITALEDKTVFNIKYTEGSCKECTLKIEYKAPDNQQRKPLILSKLPPNSTNVRVSDKEKLVGNQVELNILYDLGGKKDIPAVIQIPV